MCNTISKDLSTEGLLWLIAMVMGYIGLFIFQWFEIMGYSMTLNHKNSTSLSKGWTCKASISFTHSSVIRSTYTRGLTFIVPISSIEWDETSFTSFVFRLHNIILM